MMEVDPSSSPPLEENIAEENQEENSNSRPGSADQITENGTTDDCSDSELWLDFKCVFCNQDLKSIQNPKLLQCLHTACESCLSAEANDNSEASSIGVKQISCPVCSQEILADHVVDHLFLKEYVQSAETLPEESSFPCSCEEGVEGTSFCEECQDWLCDACVDAHHRVRMTKDHTIRLKEDMEGENIATKNQKYIVCPTHPPEQLKLYCETCDKLTCRDCQLSDHKEHDYQFLYRACEEEKNHISELLGKLKEKQGFLETAKMDVNKRNEEILEREKAVTQEIKTFSVKFISDINKRSKALLQDLNKVCTDKKEKLRLRNEDLKSISEKLKHCQKFAEAAVSLGSETALVYSKKSIMNQLRRLLKQRCDVPNQNETVDISFYYEASFFPQYIETAGKILVDQQPINGAQNKQNLMLPSNVPPSPMLNNTTPMRQQQMQVQHMSPQMNQHPRQQINQQSMVYGQPQVTPSNNMVSNQQMRQITKQPQQIVYNARMPRPVQGNSMNPQSNFNMQQQNATVNQMVVHRQPIQQMRQMQPQQQQQPIQRQQQQRQPIQQQQMQQQQQPQPIQQVNYTSSSNSNNSNQLPAHLRQNKNLSVTPLPTNNGNGPSPNKQRAIAPRSVSLTPVNNNQANSTQRNSGPQVIVLDDSNKTPNMSNTARLSHFPAGLAATLASSHPSLQIQPANNFNSSKF